MPTKVIIHVRLWASTEGCHLDANLLQGLGQKYVAPIRAFIMPNGCSTLSRRICVASGLASGRS